MLFPWIILCNKNKLEFFQQKVATVSKSQVRCVCVWPDGCIRLAYNKILLPRRHKLRQFKYRRPIAFVQQYTYLGKRLTPKGNLTLALEHLQEKALNVFSSIRKYALLRRLNPNIVSQFLITMIFQISSYNNEIWRV